jgi:hypothetical protein
MVEEYILNMGICTSKKTCQPFTQPLVRRLPMTYIHRQRLQDLVDVHKATSVPLLSLADNPLYLRRLETNKRWRSAGPRGVLCACEE